MKKLLSQLSIGSWITLGHPAVAEIMATAGFDWLAVDLEHSAINIGQAEELIRTIDLKGIPALVRLSSNNGEQIKRVMDSGAQGVIVPMVKSSAEAVAAVEATKYPPVGTRSVGLARAQGYGTRFSEYFQWQQENSVMIVQIEHILAVNNLEDILSVEGVDGYIVGPYDLSGSLGDPGNFGAEEFLSAMDEIRRVSQLLGIPGGVHIVEPDPESLRNCVEEGNKFIAYSVDTRILDIGCRAGLNQVEEFRA